MKGTSLLLTLSLASILSITAFSTVTNDAYAQQPLFDYRCYVVDAIDPETTVILKDQFFPNGVTHDLLRSEEFCNPANKEFNQPPGTEPPNFVPHLRCWAIDDPESPVNIDVLIKDQFFPNGREHTVMEALEFCHTVFKDPGPMVAQDPGNPTGPMVPNWSGSTGLEHIANWKCYKILDTEQVPNFMRFLEDQFTEAHLAISGFEKEVEIGDAIKLCTPASKTHGVFTDLPPCEELNANEDGCEVEAGPAPGSVNVHLKCYDLTPQSVSLTIGLEDQFSEQGNTLSALDKLCTEATKELLIAGTFIPIDSVAILLAGSQMSVAWLLPALVASAGVGYGIEIARKYHKDTK